jgi:subtilisin family serine protease
MRWSPDRDRHGVRPAGESDGEADGPGADDTPARRANPDAIAGESVLSFYSNADLQAFLALARSMGAEILDTLALGNSVRLRASPELLAELLERGPMAVSVDANYAVRIPPLPLVDVREAGRRYLGFESSVLRWLGVPRENGDWGAGVTVAVLDTGVNAHPALAGAAVRRLDLLGGQGSDPSEQSAHGTAVASLIAGTGEGVFGIAPAVDLLSVRVIDESGRGDTFTIAKGIVTAVAEGAGVISISLGTRGDSDLLRQAIAHAAAAGAVVVASTGNDGALGVSYPAAYADVVAVSAVDALKQHLYFANRGAAVDLAAPGFGLAAAWTDDRVAGFSGTSAAAPLVSGAVAGILSRNPTLSAADAAALLVAYADDEGALGADPEIGAGVINPGRVEERSTAGIVDVAVALPHVARDAQSGDFAVSVLAENRGTTELASVGLAVSINALRYTLRYQSVGVGESVGRRFALAASELTAAGAAGVTVTASLDGAADMRPENNTRSVTVQLLP